MGIRQFFNSLKFRQQGGNDFLEEKAEKHRAEMIRAAHMENSVRFLAYEICVQRIAQAISKVEFQVFTRHKEDKNALYYIMNIQPNPNQSATQFWQKLVTTLYRNERALVIIQPNGWYVADNFSLDDRQAFHPHRFRDVQINGLKLDRTFEMSEVFYFTLPNTKVKRLLDGTLSMYSEMISDARHAYAKGKKSKYLYQIEDAFDTEIGTYDVDGDEEGDSSADTTAELKKFITGDSDGAFTLYRGEKLDELTSKHASMDTRDIKAMLDDVMEITSKALLIPTNLASGQVTDTSKAMSDFLTFCLDTLLRQIQTEINRKKFTQKDFAAGNYVKANAQTIKHVDILDVATNVDKLLSSGALTINDILKILGFEEIDEPWAKQRFMTKNYAPIGELLNSLEGGEKNENDKNADENQSGSQNG